jgi:hypothetical protein
MAILSYIQHVLGSHELSGCHCSIYGKLGVRNRTQAIARARALDVL